MIEKKQNLTEPVSRTTIFTDDISASLIFWRDVLGFSISIDVKIPNPGASQILGFNCEHIRVIVLSSKGSLVGNIGLAEVINPEKKMLPNKFDKSINFGETCLVIRTENLKNILKYIKNNNYTIISTPTKLELPTDDEVWEMFIRDPNGVLVNLSHHGKWKV